DLARVGVGPRLAEGVRRALALLEDPRVEAAGAGGGCVAGRPAVAPGDRVADVDRGGGGREVEIGDGDAGVAGHMGGHTTAEAARSPRLPRAVGAAGAVGAVGAVGVRRGGAGGLS